MRAAAAVIVAVVFTLALAFGSRADPSEAKPQPLTSTDLSGIWRGEQDGVMIEVIFRGREFRGTEDDADWGIRHKGGSIFATLKRVDDKKSGSVHLRFESVAKPAGTVIGYVERGERGTLKVTILPVAKEISTLYKSVEGFPLSDVKDKKLFDK